MRPARDADAAALADLLFRSPQAGRMVLGQDRSADVFARRGSYEDVHTVVADGDSGLVASGTCGLKDVSVAGEVVRAAYVFDVAVDPEARGRGLATALLADLEGWAGGRDAGLLYAHVLQGNEASVRTFTSSGYRIACDLTNRVYPVFRERPDPPPGVGHVEDWDAAAELLRSEAERFDLVRDVDGPGMQELWTSRPGWHAADVWQTPSSLLGLWDHSAVARAIPLELPIETKILDVVGRVAGVLQIPFPRAPRLGEPLTFGVLLGGVGDDAMLRRLLLAALGRAGERGLDVVITFHDARAQPSWTKAALSIPDTYQLVTKALGPGPAQRLGERPVRVDPLDL